ncbi:MAG: hypothetical protein NTW04_03680, partial [Elusimicrobia bacterium]|nr:hypothetical protein [Elusimicrobiota bacterium]
LKSRLKNVRFATAKVGALEKNPDYSPNEGIKDVADIGGKIDISNWNYKTKAEATAQGPQYFELTPQVLSRSLPSLADLRLVSLGTQIPYIIDGAEIKRSLQFNVEKLKQDDGKISDNTWKFKMPYPGLPVTEIQCSAPESVFSRRAVAYEYVKDSRGEKYRAQLGLANWSRSPGQTQKRWSINISRPVSDTIYLEIDNGNNLPLDLSGFDVFYNTNRVIFKNTQNREVWLYYGNKDAAPPVYDIALAADEMRNVSKSEVRLAQDAAPNSAEDTSSRGPAKAWFWLALIAVASALIAVIYKLLPPGNKQ